MTIPDLPQSPVMVKILQNNHSKASEELRDFVKFFVKSVLFCTPWFPISCAIFQHWIMLGISIVIIAIIYASSLKRIKKNVNLSMVGNISFISSNSTRLINMEEVHNTTLLICEMRGCIKGVKLTLEILNVCIIFLTFLNLTVNIINLFLGGILI